MLGISTEPGKDLEAMRKSEGLGDVFVMLSDRGGDASRSYAGLAGPNLLNPATYVIGLDGKIAYRYVGENYQVRASAQEVLEAVKKTTVK